MCFSPSGSHRPRPSPLLSSTHVSAYWVPTSQLKFSGFLFNSLSFLHSQALLHLHSGLCQKKISPKNNITQHQATGNLYQPNHLWQLQEESNRCLSEQSPGLGSRKGNGHQSTLFCLHSRAGPTALLCCPFHSLCLDSHWPKSVQCPLFVCVLL